MFYIPLTLTQIRDARQQAVYLYILKYWRENWRSPTIREISVAIPIPSTSNVVYHLEKLEEMGYIRRGENGESRSIVPCNVDLPPLPAPKPLKRMKPRRQKIKLKELKAVTTAEPVVVLPPIPAPPKPEIPLTMPSDYERMKVRQIIATAQSLINRLEKEHLHLPELHALEAAINRYETVLVENQELQAVS